MNVNKVLDIVDVACANIDGDDILFLMEAAYFECQKKCSVPTMGSAFICYQQKRGFCYYESSIFLNSKETQFWSYQMQFNSEDTEIIAVLT